MVDAAITPQSVARTKTPSLNTLQGGQLPSLRSVQSVQTTGSEATVNFFINAATDAGRLQQASAEQFEAIQNEIKQAQGLEAEAKFLETIIAADEAVEEVRNTATIDDDIPSLTLEKYREVYGSVLEQEGLSAFQREILGDKFKQTELNVANEALNYQSQLKDLAVKESVQKYAQASSIAVFNNPGRLDAILANTEQAFEDLGLNQKEILKQKLAFQQTIATSAIRGLIKQSPGAALKKLEAGHYDENIDAGDKEQLLAMAKSRIKKPGLSNDQILQRVKIKQQISDDPFSVTDKDLFQARDNGLISNAETERLLLARERSKAEFNVSQAEFDIVDQAIAGETALSANNTNDKKLVDNYYDKVVAPALAEADPAQSRLINAEIVDRLGIVPKALEDKAVAIARSGNPSQIVEMAEEIEAIESSSGGRATFDIPVKDRAFLNKVSLMVQGNKDPDLAVAKAEQAINQSETLRDLREKEFDKGFRESASNLRDKLSDKLGADVSSQLSNLGPLVDQVYRDAKEMAVTMGDGDINSALDFAINKAKKTYGVTNVEGRERVIAHAPESYLPEDPIDGGYDYIKNDLTNVVSSFLKERGENFDPELNEFTLIPTTDTRKAISKIGVPVYNISVMTEQGLVIVPQAYMPPDIRKATQSFLNLERQEAELRAVSEAQLKRKEKERKVRETRAFTDALGLSKPLEEQSPNAPIE